ncbi:MAG TPA: class I SAM-dependent methyltransferase [Deltaproteobacteria bacterium]|nr:class I SAM-dependent methyltransferase [Deltaproteobacteria bacterium]
MPWFHRELDHDLAAALDELGIEGGDVLDLGAGPGTQAVALAKRGFRVTAADISAAAVRKAAELAGAEGVDVRFAVDDICGSSLCGPFDMVFDRGCFHVIAPDDRPVYVRTVRRLLRPRGLLFLKTFSTAETTVEGGPYRFTAEMIRDIFEGSLEVLSVRESSFRGTLDHEPLALFCILERPA